MEAFFKIPTQLLQVIREDLKRPHQFAFERVGFVLCKPALTTNSLGVYAFDYCVIPDDEYVEDLTVGAMMGSGAIRRALTLAYNEGKEDVSVFHIHAHIGEGIPWFSRIDLRESAKFVPDFFNTAPQVPHGVLVTNDDHMAGLIWVSKKDSPKRIHSISNVGAPLKISQWYEGA